MAGGANLICFTTRRGSAYGCAPSPSLKLSTNTALWMKQEDDMDIDCGGIVEGSDTVDAAGERIFRLVLEAASGRASKSELHGYGQNEFVPWQLGAVRRGAAPRTPKGDGGAACTQRPRSRRRSAVQYDGADADRDSFHCRIS